MHPDDELQMWGILLVAALVLSPVIGFVGYWVFWLLKLGWQFAQAIDPF